MLDGGDLTELERALHEVGAVPLSCLSAVELVDRAVALEKLSSQLSAIRCATLAAVSESADGAGAFANLGFRHATDAVIASTKADGRRIRQLTRTGRWLLEFPIFAEAFAAGMISHRHVAELHKLDGPRVHHALVESQETLVAAARTCDFPDFVNVLIYWLNAADPDGEEPAEHAARTRCSYRKHSDGSVSGNFHFDPLTGQAFRRLLGVETQRLFRLDAEAEPEVRRSTGQRQGAALINLMVRGSESGGDSSITPLIHLVMGQQLAESLVQQLAGEPVAPVAPDFHDLDRRCELADGTPIHAKLAVAALASARFRRMVFDAESKPVEVATRSRRFPPWMKQVLLVKARGRCQIPGCDAPFPWLQADHLHPHSKGGPTKLSNGQILCDPHNKRKRDT